MSQKRKILITGASGFVGRGLVDFFTEAGWSVVGSGRKTNALAGGAYQTADLALGAGESERLLALTSPAAVIHCAGVKDVRWCESHSAEAHRINVDAAGWMAMASRKAGAQFLLISTDLVFAADKGGYQESDIPDATSIYGKTKALAEAAVGQAFPGAMVCRTGGVYGKSSPLFRWLKSELIAEKKVEAFEDVKNTPTYIPDLGAICEKLLEKNASGLFHACGPQKVSRFDWFRAFASAYGFNADQIVPSKASGKYRELMLFPDSSLDSAKVYAATGVRPHDLAGSFEQLKLTGGL